ncbi:MAG: hypothetical protein K0R61_4391 [Microvirga sp.]|nr:hypothetical protein [Microvirga sp.]
MTRDDQDRLAAEHVLGLLEGEERGAAERLLASDASFQVLVQQWRTRFAEWDNTASHVAPDTSQRKPPASRLSWRF